MEEDLKLEEVSTEESSLVEYPPFIIVYQCNYDWVYVGETQADLSPLEQGVYLIPAFAVETPPPPYDAKKQFCEWNGSEWLIKEIPVPPPPEPPSRDEIIKEKTSKIMLTRDKHNTGGVFALDHWWPTNLVTIPQWNYLRDMAREIKFDGGDMDAVMTDLDGNPFNWQTLDNGDIGLTANMVVTITNMGARNVNQNSQNAKRHIANLNASEHPEDYDYSDGWTDIYES
jgi:hypothetical protein